MRTAICEALGIEFPIFAFSHCRDVVAAVTQAGGFGVLGALGFTPEELELELRWLDRRLAGMSYGVDIVIPAKYVGRDRGDLDVAQLKAMVPEENTRFVEALLERHNVPPLPDTVDAVSGEVGWSVSGGGAHLDVSLRHDVKLVVNALGPPPPEVIERIHAAGAQVAALVGTPAQARKQKARGVDIIVAVGTEAGGHTGDISTMVLVPQVVDAVAPTPVLAAGGIGDGRQVAASMALGAAGVWTGSIWLTVREANELAVVREKLLAARSNETVRSRCLTGKPVRQLVTDYTRAWDSDEAPRTLPMPLQMMATAGALQRVYRHATSGHPDAGDLMGSPVGQIVGMMNDVRSSRDVLEQMVSGYIDAVSGLARGLGMGGEGDG